MNSRSDGVSEDCLYLNVWTPAKRNSKGLPVLVYFFGGGFVRATALNRAMTRQHAKRNCGGDRELSFKYLWLFSPSELSAEAPYKGSGNYGLLIKMRD